MSEKEYLIPFVIILAFILIITVGIPLLSKVSTYLLNLVFKIFGNG